MAEKHGVTTPLPVPGSRTGVMARDFTGADTGIGAHDTPAHAHVHAYAAGVTGGMASLPVHATIDHTGVGRAVLVSNVSKVAPDPTVGTDTAVLGRTRENPRSVSA
ncbi:hypothetical protein OKJ48_22575 [Streptomyces kunmingensis]|uniref:Uncharacterized protein n=1 Tax=Streptomyces kunmingensis TaxID=68225 RepID=A0ABU6CE80_9ACTN|nr:hypothetical protein [Streptomyces kunmingensis]MEB3963011.1 hypothetical protein [Streptomyces kunmingensis]